MIVLDGNIFGLQRYGGVSGYMARVACGLTDIGLSPSLVYPSRFLYEGFGSNRVSELPAIAQERISPKLTQYFSARVRGGEDIFHSAYYRLPCKKVHKYIITVHDFTYEYFRRGPGYWLHHKLKADAIAAADEVICVSESTRADLLSFFPKICPSKVSVIYHGVDTLEFFPERATDSSSWEDHILFLGQRGGYKRFDLAVDTLRCLPEFQLAIVGPPLSKQETKMLVEKIGTRWRWFGQLDAQKLRVLYSSVHAFIYPSDYEGFGLPILEALACGCPVVVSKLSCFPEIGANSVLYAEGQKPEAYAFHIKNLEDSSERMNLNIRGHNLVSKHGWQSSIHKLTKVYFR